MIYVLGGGGGSGGSELVIVGGITSPAKAAHNTIWIETDKEITSHVLSATEPENPVEGMAWVTIGDSGSIKVISPVGGDWVTVYPLSAKQYVGGAWVDKTATSYQNGEWVDWITEVYLFKNGDQCVDITGGWSCGRTDFTVGTINANGNLYLSGTKKMFGTPNQIPKGKYTAIYFEVVNVKQHSGDPSAVILIKDSAFDTSSTPIGKSAPTSGGTVRIDLSGVDTEFYIVMYTYYSDEILEISEIWME